MALGWIHDQLVLKEVLWSSWCQELLLQLRMQPSSRSQHNGEPQLPMVEVTMLIWWARLKLCAYDLMPAVIVERCHVDPNGARIVNMYALEWYN